MAAFPSVVDAVFARAEAVVTPAARVVRGRDVSDTPGDVVLVGIQDVEDQGWTQAGSFRQSMQTFGGGREEVGTVNGLILSNSGTTDQTISTSAAFGYLELLEADVRDDPTLGLTGFDYVVAEMDSGEIRELQSEYGASTVLPFVITYKIRI